MLKKTVLVTAAALAVACFDAEPTDTDTDCAGFGVWYDESSDLCWQEPPSDAGMNWNPAVTYCDDLMLDGYTDWRLPNVDELISLIRGCQDGNDTGDLSPSLCEMMPAGCTTTDDCSRSDNCSSCPTESGPVSGCYWDLALSGQCSYCWSSSSLSSEYAWVVDFDNGNLSYFRKTNSYFARCVRGGP